MRQEGDDQPEAEPATAKRRNAAIIRPTINLCWFFFKWGFFLLLVLGIGGGVYFYYHVDEELRRGVEAKFAQAYPGLKVRVRHAQLRNTGEQDPGIEVRGLSISEASANGPQPELLYIDELFLACNPEIQDLVRGRLNISFIRVSRPVLHLTRRPDATWSAQRLLPLPKLSESAPNGVIENGTVEIFDPLKIPSSTLTLRDLHFKFSPQGIQSGRALKFEGHLSGDHLRQLEVWGQLDPDRQTFDLQGQMQGLALSPEFRGALPESLAGPLAKLGTLRGTSDINFKLRSSDHQSPPQWSVAGRLHEGRLEHPALPLPLTEMEVAFRCDPRQMLLEQLTAHSGDAELQVKGVCQGHTVDSPSRFWINGERIMVNRKMAALLPPSLAEAWNNFQPEGMLAIRQFELAYDGRTWQPAKGEIVLQDMSFTHRQKFPYRVEHGSGVLQFEGDHLRTQPGFRAFAGARPVQFKLDVVHPGPNWTGHIEIAGDQILLDKKFLDALPSKARQPIGAMRAQGTLQFHFEQHRQDGHQPPHYAIHAELQSCHLNYEKFAYPIDNIRGALECTDGHWRFVNLQGTNDSGTILCDGQMDPCPRLPDGVELRLRFQGKNIALEEELRTALGPGPQQAWDALRPRGQVDLLAELAYSSLTHQVEISLPRLEPLGDTSVRPVAFPYRMEKVRGLIEYRDHVATFHDLRADNRSTTVGLDGSWRLEPNGGWALRLTNLRADQLRPDLDHDLVDALPDGLRRTISELKPKGAINLTGDLGFTKPDAGATPLVSHWDLKLNLSRLKLDNALQIENVYGAVSLRGEAHGAQFVSQGDLAVDSLSSHNFQITNISGPISIDNQQVLLGAWTEKDAKEKSTHSLVGYTLGGRLFGDGRIQLVNHAPFQLQATLSGADLGQFARENLTDQKHLNGKFVTRVNLEGNSTGLHTLRGRGQLHLAEADIYELPVMVSLLAFLSVRPPETNAFTDSDIDFQIKEEHLEINRIRFVGNAMTLEGQGDISFKQVLNLSLHAVVGRADSIMPVLHGVLGKASDHIMQIHITGPLDHPEMRKEVLPYLSQTMQQMQAGFQEPLRPPPENPPRSAALRGLLHR